MSKKSAPYEGKCSHFLSRLEEVVAAKGDFNR